MEVTTESGVGVLQLDGLTRRFGVVTALDDLSFRVPSGQVVGFLGPNGAGKTNTMRAIFALVDLDAGAVRWNGVPVGATQRRRFGYMPEERGLYPGMLVGEQLEYLGLVGLDAVTWWQFTLSAILTATSAVAMSRLAATVYRRAILRTGRRVRLREIVSEHPEQHLN